MVEGITDNMVSESCKRIHKKSLRAIFTILCGLLAGLILCSHTAYAADENIPSDLVTEGSDTDPSVTISAEDDYILREGSKELANILYSTDDVRATDYAQQIYNYLVNTIHTDLTNIGTRQNTTNTRLNSILSCLNGNSSTNTYLYDVIVSILYDGLGYVPNSATGGYLNVIANQLSYQTISPSSNFTLMDMMFLLSSYYVDGAGSGYSWDSMGANLSTIAGNSGGTVLAINGLSNKLDQLNTLSYTDVTSYFQLLGISETFDGTYTLPSSNTTLDAMYLKIHVSGTVNTFNGLKIRLPISYPYNQIRTIKMYVKYIDEQIEVPIEYLVNMNTIYILDCPDTFSTADIYLYVDANPQPARITYSPSASVSLKVEICSDSVSQKDYYADLAILDINRKLSALDIIKNEIASPDLVQAKEESEPTTKQALEDFTGDGSSAPTPSTVSTASDISDSMREGFDTGESADSALTVFNPANALWGWFSEDNASYFTPNFPSRSKSDSKNKWDNVTWTDDIPNITPVIEQDIHDITRGEDK